MAEQHVLMVTLRDGTTADVGDALAKELAGVAEIDQARRKQERSIDPQQVIVVLEVAAKALTTLAAAWELFRKVRDTLAARKVTGAKITLPNGARVELDAVTQDEVKKLVDDLRDDPP